jgi:hypothetical protein
MSRPHPEKLLDWRKALIYIHRWSGIVLTTVFVVWFVSGIVFVYVGMPTLPAEERLKRLAPLDLATLRVTPAEAVARLELGSGAPAARTLRGGVESTPSRMRIAMHDSRPVYRFQSGPGWRMVYADTGEPLAGFSADDAMSEMRRYVPEHATTLRYERRLVDSDQWTLQGIIRSNMPMHRIALDDAAGTEYYVSERTGEPVLRTTASGRFWGYLGAVLHWMYFTPLRRYNAFWNSFVVWTSLIGTAMCAMGIAIGIWRYSLSGRFRLRREPSHTPYAGWMKWHHYAGLLFGLFACTWAFSGAMSLSPFAMFQASAQTRAFREAATGGPIDLAPLTLDRIRAAAATVRGALELKELDFFQFMGEPYFIAYAPPGASESAPWRNIDIAAATALNIDRTYVMVSALHPERGTFTSFDRDRMWDVAKAAMPGVAVADSAWLTEYDAYYYSQEGMKPLPVLRLRYDDPQQTWLYLDPQCGVIAQRYERATRWSRWLYHGFHSLDFPFLYYKRPLWDLVVWALSLGGIAISVTSALPAWRRLARHVRGWLAPRRAPAPAQPESVTARSIVEHRQ